MIKRYTVELRDSGVNAWSEKLCVDADKNGEYVYYTDHAAEVARLEQELENLQNKHDALADSLTRNNALWSMDSNAMEGIREERDAALAEVARMRPVVEAAVAWLSDLTEYAELELERTARDYRDKAELAAARADVPALLDHIGELEAQIAAMRPVVEAAVVFYADRTFCGLDPVLEAVAAYKEAGHA